MKRYCERLLLLPLLLMTTLTLCANGQSPKGSSSTVTDKEKVVRLTKALSQALDENVDLKAKLAAANDAIEALKKDQEAARAAAAAGAIERAKADQAIALADAIIEKLQKLIPLYERALEMQAKLIEKQGQRVDSLETKLDKANSRTVKAGVLGFVAGLLANLVKVF